MRSRLRAEVVGQACRFGVVGVGNTLLSLAAYEALAAAGLPAAAAGAAAFSAGAVNGYLWNRRWTFRAHDSAGARLRYLVVQLGGAAATGVLAWSVGYLLALPLVTAATFLANRRWTFSQPYEPSSEPYALR